MDARVAAVSSVLGTGVFLSETMRSPSFIPAAIYVSFTNSIAFSPTDAMPLSRWAKLLMAAESALSSLTVLLVAARAVNIFK